MGSELLICRGMGGNGLQLDWGRAPHHSLLVPKPPSCLIGVFGLGSAEADRTECPLWGGRE